MSLTTDKMRDKKLQVLDPELPFLASDAAIELDNALSGIRSEFQAVKRIGRLLQSSFTVVDCASQPRSLVDPATLTVLGDAINQTPKGQRVTTMEELIKEACSIANQLTDPEDDESEDQIKWARDFCVALSRKTIAYRSSIHSAGPQHPYRR
jgi:hypothetical protein